MDVPASLEPAQMGCGRRVTGKPQGATRAEGVGAGVDIEPDLLRDDVLAVGPAQRHLTAAEIPSLQIGRRGKRAQRADEQIGDGADAVSTRLEAFEQGLLQGVRRERSLAAGRNDLGDLTLRLSPRQIVELIASCVAEVGHWGGTGPWGSASRPHSAERRAATRHRAWRRRAAPSSARRNWRPRSRSRPAGAAP